MIQFIQLQSLSVLLLIGFHGLASANIFCPDQHVSCVNGGDINEDFDCLRSSFKCSADEDNFKQAQVCKCPKGYTGISCQIPNKDGCKGVNDIFNKEIIAQLENDNFQAECEIEPNASILSLLNILDHRIEFSSANASTELNLFGRIPFAQSNSTETFCGPVEKLISCKANNYEYLDEDENVIISMKDHLCEVSSNVPYAFKNFLSLANALKMTFSKIDENTGKSSTIFDFGIISINMKCASGSCTEKKVDVELESDGDANEETLDNEDFVIDDVNEDSVVDDVNEDSNSSGSMKLERISFAVASLLTLSLMLF